MAEFAITYDLNKQKNYKALWDELDRLGGHKSARSFYFLDLTAESAKEVRDHFVQFIDNDDILVVVKVLERPATHRPFKGTTAWLDARF